MGLKPRATSNEMITVDDERVQEQQQEHEGFAKFAIKEFAKVSQRTFTPPHWTLFRVARRAGYQHVYINGWTEATWKLKMDELIEKGDRRVFALSVYLNGPFDHSQAIGFGWANDLSLRRTKVRGPIIGLDSPLYCQPCADAGRKDRAADVFVAEWRVDDDRHHWTAACNGCAEGWYERNDGLPHVEVQIAGSSIKEGSFHG